MYTVSAFAFKCEKGLAPSYLSDLFVTRSTVHDRNTREFLFESFLVSEESYLLMFLSIIIILTFRYFI